MSHPNQRRHDHAENLWSLSYIGINVILITLEGSRPEWCISGMIYSRDTPFWSETFDIYLQVLHVSPPYPKDRIRCVVRGRDTDNPWLTQRTGYGVLWGAETQTIPDLPKGQDTAGRERQRHRQSPPYPKDRIRCVVRDRDTDNPWLTQRTGYGRLWEAETQTISDLPKGQDTVCSERQRHRQSLTYPKDRTRCVVRGRDIENPWLTQRTGYGVLWEAET